MSQINELSLGSSFSFRKTMSVAEQAMFTGISGNMAPLYVDKVKAQQAGAANMVVFELAAASLATTCMNRLGGASRRIASFDVKFPAPLLVGDTLEAKAVVEAIDGTTVHCTITGTVVGSGVLVFTGSATLVAFNGLG
jgi:3-hydroxybutyryl-CoA dehydratase